MARKIMLEGPRGVRWIEEGKPFRFQPGERIAEVDGRPVVEMDESERELRGELEKAGVQWGDAVARLTEALGIKHCSKCEARRRILNEAGKLGVKETMRRFWEIK